MNNQNLPEENLKEKIYWCLMLCLCIIPLALVVYKLPQYSFGQLMVLCVTIAISMLISGYRYTVPGTQTDISAGSILVFWSIVWLGIPGGVLLAATISLSRFHEFQTARQRSWLFGLYSDLVAAFISAGAFYLSLQYLTGRGGMILAQNHIGLSYLLIGTGLMITTHFLIKSASVSLYLRLNNTSKITAYWRTNFNWSAGIYIVSAVSTLCLHFTFKKFGIDFGLVVLPMVVAAHLVYKFFLRLLEQKTAEIKETSRIHLATVEALATAIDVRDQVGIGHVRRTQIYAVGIGEVLGLAADEIKALNTGALLHGIGKLAVPDNILNKPGKLTPAEMEKTKVSSSVAASIIDNINFPYPVVPTVKHHNEMWNGDGYPDGLHGEKIPMTARILAVADAYDTLRGERPYRPAISRDEARRILQSRAGLQFDPKIVDVFLRNLRRLEAKIEEKGLSYNQDTGIQTVHVSEDQTDNSYVAQIKLANREVFTLYELARVFSSSLNLEETLILFAERIQGLVPFDTCAIYLMDQSNSFALAAHTDGKNSIALENKRIRIGEGATGYVLQECKAVHNVNPALDFSFDPIDFVEDYTTMAALPLIADDKLLGAVSLYSCELETYGEEHLRLLEMIAHIASDAVSMAIQHAESETRALTDPMTDLPNARSLQIEFEKEVARADRNGSIFQLLMLDLDGFKAVNDTFGHKIGDRMLKELARVMQKELRDYDFLSRYAGDEFVVIVPETNSAGIQELCHRMEKAVREFRLPLEDGRTAMVGVSVGASCYPKDGKTIDQIIISADKKMYSVKAERKLKQTMPTINVKPQTPDPLPPEPVLPDDERFVLELDESHIISKAIN